MPAVPVIAIFDIGKTNKKILLFNEQYEVVYEQAERLPETTDKDGFPCENLENLRAFIHHLLQSVFKNKSFEIKAINVAAYGASFVYIDENGEPVLPLYNYLKPYPESLQQQLYAKYGGAASFAVATASPILGSLNSGLQLYRIKEEHPLIFQKIKYALHLPQYISYLITGCALSDITSIGCHTALWDFEKVGYHHWVEVEGLVSKLAPIHATKDAVTTKVFGSPCKVGIGVHDSSAALIPYQMQFQEPFVLLSTGTWCISLNPFNNSALTPAELAQDCLCYLDYEGRPVKAARLHLGPQYDAGTARIGAYFQQDSMIFKNIRFDAALVQMLNEEMASAAFAESDMSLFKNAIEAYHQLMISLVRQQAASAYLVLQNCSVKQIFVDGGFSKNEVYMHLLAAFFPDKEVFAASMAQGTALGAALAIHSSWNENTIPTNLIRFKRYA